MSSAMYCKSFPYELNLPNMAFVNTRINQLFNFCYSNFKKTFFLLFPSFLIIFWMTRLSGLSPFMGDNDLQTMSNVTSGEYDFDDEAFDVISDEGKNFIGKLLVRNPRYVDGAVLDVGHVFFCLFADIQDEPCKSFN